MKKILITFTLLLLSLILFIKIGFKNQSTQSSCVFCQESVLEVQTIYATDRAAVIQTHKPVVDGHVLIIPKRHVERFEELTLEEIGEMQEAIKRVDRAEKNLYGNPAYLLLQKNGTDAGQSVPHVHFHYLPRQANESHVLFALRMFLADLANPITREQMEESVISLRSEIDRTVY